MCAHFNSVFGKGKAIIGMIHLAGKDLSEKINRAKEEIEIYLSEGVKGVIVEDYHGSLDDVELALWDIGKSLREVGFVGVNTLKSPLYSFDLCQRYGLKFLQLDDVTSSADFNENKYKGRLQSSSGVCVLGGVRFKYRPQTGKSLEEDIIEGMSRCDAVVTTGQGTGIETPLEKLRNFREIMGNFPLIVGAGVTAENVKPQLDFVDGAIVGSYFKGGNTENPVQKDLVRRLMDEVRSI